MIANNSKTRSDSVALALPAANAAVALIALVLAALALYEAAHLRTGEFTRPASAAAAESAARPIVPSPVIDPGEGRFIGTGDGANGVWVRP